MKLLLPLDVANSYRQSIAELERLVPLAEADIFVLYVRESTRGLESILTSMGKSAQHLDQELDARAKTVLDEAASILKERCRSVVTQIVDGSPPQAIEQLAARQGFDLVAIGATQHGSNPLNLLGSTAAHVVKHAQAPVIILRSRPQAEANLKVLIAVDGSPPSTNALRTFASQFGALKEKLSVTILNVVSIFGIWKFVAPVEFIASIEDNLNMAAETILADADKTLSEYKLTPTNMVIRSGDAGNEIIKAANDIEADLIVVGARSRSGVEQIFLGSVSHKLSMHAPCSTIVVK